jgi:hypothetical protein
MWFLSCRAAVHIKCIGVYIGSYVYASELWHGLPVGFL